MLEVDTEPKGFAALKYMQEPVQLLAMSVQAMHAALWEGADRRIKKGIYLSAWANNACDRRRELRSSIRSTNEWHSTLMSRGNSGEMVHIQTML